MCTESPTKECSYDIKKYARDDMGFWVPCIHCGIAVLVEGYTINDLYKEFDMGDDEDYSNDDDED